MPQKRVFLFSRQVFSFHDFFSSNVLPVRDDEEDMRCAVEARDMCRSNADSSVIDWAGRGVGEGCNVVCMSGMPGSVPATGARL